MTTPSARISGALSAEYRLEREIGAGGMATVYLAEDLRHDRRVALKVLRPELAAVIGAERFLAEIKLTANLQHPHILPLFDSGEADSFLYYVMPFVEGESLRDRLRREKQLPVDEAVRIASEVASALDYAHRHGVVHRDIKPENILLHDGRALVADFGIALAASKAGTRMTETGMSLGTPHYMSPEQAMGEREITARSDVYALGAVLYEMLTGDPPFTGSTAQAIVARVVTEAPRPMLPQRHTIPPHVEAAVLTALEKLPADRFATAAEFAESLADTAAQRTVPVRTLPARSSRGRVAMLVGGGLLGAAVTGLALRALPRPAQAPPAPARHWSIVLPDSAPLAYIGGGTLGVGRLALALSPDGSTLVYVGRRAGNAQLFRRKLDESTVTPIAGTEGAYDPFFSPDGQWIAFFAGPELRKVPAAGGTPVMLAQTPEPWGASWVSPEQILVTSREGSTLAWVPAAGGPLEPVSLSGAGAFNWPTVLPDRRHALGFVWFRSAQVGIAAVDLSSGRVVALTERGPIAADSVSGSDIISGADPRLLSSDHLAFTRGGRLMTASFNPVALRTTGPAVELVAGIRQEQGGRAQYVVTPDGTLIYAEGALAGVANLVWVSATGQSDTLPFAGEPYGTFDLSSDGRRVVTQIWRPTSGIELRVLDLERGQSIKVATQGVPLAPRWWPDGKRIVFTEQSPRPPYAQATVRQLPGSVSRRDTLLVGWSIDEISSDTTKLEALGYRARTPGVWLIPLADPKQAVPVDTFPGAWGGAFSKDGRWIAYTSSEAGRYEIYVVRRDLTGERQKVSLAGGEEPRWSPRGDRLIYRWGQDWFSVSVPRVTGSEFGVAQRVLSGPFINVADRSHDVGPDGRHLLLLGPREETTTRLEVITDWMDEVRRKAPHR
jgi:serine/threonine-protein kinase